LCAGANALAIEIALFGFLHILVLVYWLGGDLGAFYASSFVTDPKRSEKERMLAVTIVNSVDLAPRFSMIAAFPTGLALGAVKGWLLIPIWSVGLAFALAFVWGWVAWQVHVKHGPAGDPYKRIDTIWRWIFIALLIAGGVAIVLRVVPAASFLGLKMLLLALTVLLGLRIRAQLKDFGPALVSMMQNGASPESDAALERTLGAARPTVLAIWVCLITAGFLGVWTPNF
jgi:hypothetical protein